MPAAPRVAPAALAVSPAAATRAQRGVGARDPLLSRCCSSADPAVGACAGPIGLHGGGDRDRWPVAANARCEQSPTLVYALREFPKWTSIPPTGRREYMDLIMLYIIVNKVNTGDYLAVCCILLLIWDTKGAYLPSRSSPFVQTKNIRYLPPGCPTKLEN